MLDTEKFYKKPVNMWNEVNNQVKVPVCTCKGCKCGAIAKIVHIYEEDKSHQLLMGLMMKNSLRLGVKYLFKNHFLILIGFLIWWSNKKITGKWLSNVMIRLKLWLCLQLMHPQPSKILTNQHAHIAVNLGRKKQVVSSQLISSQMDNSAWWMWTQKTKRRPCSSWDCWTRHRSNNNVCNPGEQWRK